MHDLDLVESHSPIGLRQMDTILDTDDEKVVLDGGEININLNS